ncbi:unnamed protein product [Fusarium graminearum]|uniref:Uncharacterized protein n=1 Tax=Gibberella zeae TaxID=5518 RepID=A0A9N8WTJ4_GIBZA|nr:unnamed protein product [Fusarium graminearum]CAG1963873.1 unnamed protein product [Fusarium graminearum]CAG1990755.1 unnamed protein product [Fusarium graminearum]
MFLLLVVGVLARSTSVDLFRVVANAGLAGVGSEVLAESALLEVHILPVGALGLGGLVTEVDTLGKLPCLDTTKEQSGSDKDNGPLPSNTLVLKDGVTDDGNVLDREESDNTEDNGPEEELVAPDVVHPLGKVELGLGLHAEERSSLVNHLPGKEEREPGKTGKSGSTGLEDGLTAVAVSVVAVLTELTIAKGVHAEDEGAETKSGDPDTIDGHVNDKLERENTSLERDGRSLHNTSDGALETETHVGKTRGGHNNPHDLDGGNREDGETGSVLKDKTDKQNDSLSNVGGEDVENELLDVVKDTATFLNGSDNGSKVVITENNIGGVLGDIGTGLTHGNTNIGTAERGRIVNTITKLVTSVEGFNHADLGLRSTSGNDKREERKLVDFIVGKTIKGGSSHNHGVDSVLGNHVHASGQDTDLNSNSLGGLGVVTGKHVHRDTSLVTGADSRGRLETRRIVKTNETTEDEITLNSGSVNLVTLLHVDVVGLGSKSKDTETHTSKRLHVAENLLTELISDGDLLLAILGAVSSTGTNDTLDSTLGVGKELAGSVVLHNDRHALDIRVERKLGNLTVLVGGIVAGELETVPVETRSKDLDSNLGRVTTGVPLASLFVDSGKVGKRSNFEELGQGVLALGEKLIGGRNNTALITTSLERKLMRLLARPAELTNGRVVGLGSVLNKVGSLSRSPGTTGNHLTLGKSTGLVGANIGNSTKGLEGLEVSNNNVTLNHALGTGSHGDGQDDDQTGRNHRQTSGDGIDNNLLGGIELVGGKDDNSTDDSSTKEVDCQSGQLLLERCADIYTEETTNSIGKSKSVGFEVSVRLGRTIRLTLHGTDLAVLLSESSSDSTNLGGCSSSKDNTLGATLGNSRGAVGDVDTVTRPAVVVENLILVLSNGKRLTICIRDRVASLDFHKITGNDLNRGDNLGVSITDDASSGRRHVSQRIHSLLGRVFLEETDSNIETNDEGDDTTLNP